MSAVLDQEAAERQRAKDAATAQSALIKQQEHNTAAESVPVVHQVSTKPLDLEAATPVLKRSSPMTMSPPFQGVFCRDIARGGFDRPIPVKCEAMSC
jgi:hypothetical protein